MISLLVGGSLLHFLEDSDVPLLFSPNVTTIYNQPVLVAASKCACAQVQKFSFRHSHRHAHAHLSLAYLRSRSKLLSPMADAYSKEVSSATTDSCSSPNAKDYTALLFLFPVPHAPALVPFCIQLIVSSVNKLA